MKLNDSFSQLKLDEIDDITENISEAKIKLDTIYKKHFPFKEQIILSRNKPQICNRRSIETRLATLREKSKSLCSYHFNKEKDILCINNSNNALSNLPLRQKDHKYNTLNLLSPINKSTSALLVQQQQQRKSTLSPSIDIISNNNNNNYSINKYNLILSPLATSRSLTHLRNNSNPLPNNSSCNNNNNTSKSLLLSFSSLSNKCNEQLDKSNISLQKIQRILLRIEKSKKVKEKEKQKALNKRLLFIYPKERNTKFRFVSEDQTNIMIQSESIERIGEVGSYANRDIVKKNYQVKVTSDDVFNYPEDNNNNNLNQLRQNSMLLTQRKLLNHTNEWINKLNSSMRKFDKLHYKQTAMTINLIDNNNNNNDNSNSNVNVNLNPKITINS